VAEREERERFAVAALAQCLKYDRVLLKHFWQRVCRVPGDPSVIPDIAATDILLEPPHWADLRVVSDNHSKRFVWVIEVKAGTRLDERQRPDRPDVFMRPGYGYGALFVEEEKRRGTRMRFVILGARPEDNLAISLGAKRVAPIVLQQRRWEDLADGFPQTRLCKDLATCLGNLGIRAFPAAQVKNMKVNTKQTDIGKAVAILEEVQRRLDWLKGRTAVRGFQLDEGLWSVGTDLIDQENANAIKLKEFLQPPDRYLAWFGYQGKAGSAAELAIWLYCGSDEIQQKTELCLRTKGFSPETRPREGNYFNVVVKATTHSKNNDCDWFCSIFQSLGLKEKK